MSFAGEIRHTVMASPRIMLRDNQNPMLCVNQTCKSYWAVCYVGVHRSSRMLAAEIRVKPGLRLPPSVAIGLDADRGREPPLQSLLAGLIVAGSGSLIVAQQMKLPELRSALYKAFAANQITKAEAETLDTLINTKAAIPAPEKPVQRCIGSRPRSSASMERRRSWAAAGRLPPALAAQFTLAEQAVLAAVASEVKKHGACKLTVGHIAALAGVSDQTVRNALRQAQGLALLTIEERRRTAWMNHPNKVEIVSKEWAAWLRLATGQNSWSPRSESKRRRENGLAQRRENIDAGSFFRSGQDPAQPDKGIRQSRGG
jgi:Bacterial regulatory proteins, gntR family